MQLDQCLARWGLMDPRLIATTATSEVWVVRQADDQAAVLKLLKPGQTEEARGAVLLQMLVGRGTVQVYALDGPVILMEHCPGPSLGDLARAGQGAEATEILCSVVQTLHAARPDIPHLEPVATRFAPLTDGSLDGDLAEAARIARDLLANPVPPAALHGDLHHDNILRSPRGWLAIDAKGVSGDPAYEPANAFRNSGGLGERLFDPSRIHHLAKRFSRSLGLSSHRLLGWAAARCALSTRWSLEAGQDITEDLRLLPLLLAARAGL
jgi:streptomycin 6-kinase